VRESSDLKVICLYLLEGKKKKKSYGIGPTMVL
jgi:hypothetical protein